MSPQASGGFVKVLHKSSLGFRGHLITNFPNVMVYYTSPLQIYQNILSTREVIFQTRVSVLPLISKYKQTG